MKFKNLAELKAAIDTGDVQAADVLVLIDNDCTPVYAFDHAEDAIGAHIYTGPDPETLLGQALDLLGIPWEEA
jgi:hypothetical protein